GLVVVQEEVDVEPAQALAARGVALARVELLVQRGEAAGDVDRRALGDDAVRPGEAAGVDGREVARDDALVFDDGQRAWIEEGLGAPYTTLSHAPRHRRRPDGVARPRSGPRRGVVERRRLGVLAGTHRDRLGRAQANHEADGTRNRHVTRAVTCSAWARLRRR